MRYVTHHFAHAETLDRARRWLVRAGFDPGRIEAHTRGILSLAVAVEAGESAEAQRIIDAAESSDPDGHPGIWVRASQWDVDPQSETGAATAVATLTESHSFVVGWHPQDADRDGPDSGLELLRHHQEDRE
jgi:hypothetical protein